MKLTEWYPAHIKPARKGFYQIYLEGVPREKSWFSYWDGNNFSYAADTIERTKNYWLGDNERFFHSQKEWRGLAEKP